jgi:hypothetical protein
MATMALWLARGRFRPPANSMAGTLLMLFAQ